MIHLPNLFQLCQKRTIRAERIYLLLFIETVKQALVNIKSLRLTLLQLRVEAVPSYIYQ